MKVAIFIALAVFATFAEAKTIEKRQIGSALDSFAGRVRDNLSQLAARARAIWEAFRQRVQDFNATDAIQRVRARVSDRVQALGDGRLGQVVGAVRDVFSRAADFLGVDDVVAGVRQQLAGQGDADVSDEDIREIVEAVEAEVGE